MARTKVTTIFSIILSATIGSSDARSDSISFHGEKYIFGSIYMYIKSSHHNYNVNYTY